MRVTNEISAHRRVGDQGMSDVDVLAEKVRAGLWDTSNALVPNTMTEVAYEAARAFDALSERLKAAEARADRYEKALREASSEVAQGRLGAALITITEALGEATEE
jgi:hypothetical protein